MKKLLTVLMSLGLITSMSSSVVACNKPKAKWADDHDIFFVEAPQQTLEIDKDGHQVGDVNFSLSYLLQSPTTGDPTQIQITSATIASEDEDASDDTNRYGFSFNVEKTDDKSSDNEPLINYCLKFDSSQIKEFIEKVGDKSLLNFNAAINFKGNYFNQEHFSITLNFKFDLLNNYNNETPKQDLAQFIPENQRDLGVIERANDTISVAEIEELVKTKVYKTFKALANEVSTEFDDEAKKIKLIANGDSTKFIGTVTLTYSHDKNPELLPDVSQGVDFKNLPTTRMEFHQWNLAQRIQLIKDLLKDWYLIEKGQDFTENYFKYFKIENQIIDLDSTSVLVKFETPWPALNTEFKVNFMVPYNQIDQTIPNDLFADQLLEMTATTRDELILNKLNEKAVNQIKNFTEDFDFDKLDVVNQTIEIVAKTKTTNQFYEPNTKVQLNFNVLKQKLESLIGEKLKNYLFYGNQNDIYYMTMKEIILNKMRLNINTKLTNDEATLITLANEWNETNFDTTDPDKWTVKITPSIATQRYVTGEISFEYSKPNLSGLDWPLPGVTYDTPGLKQIMQLDAPFLVSTDAEIQNSYLKILNQVCAGNPFSKWVIIKNLDKKIDVTRPDVNYDYDLFGAEKIKEYLRPNTIKGVFKLGKLDLNSFFAGGINLNTPLDAKTIPEISQELYEIITGGKVSDFPGYKNLTDAIQITDVQLNGQIGSAKIEVKPGYKYSNYVLNQAEINFKLK